ncbi:MAG: hypothetical protein AAGG80_07515, partial [Pseudomonadota bacterium]
VNKIELTQVRQKIFQVASNKELANFCLRFLQQYQPKSAKMLLEKLIHSPDEEIFRAITSGSITLEMVREIQENNSKSETRNSYIKVFGDSGSKLEDKGSDSEEEKFNDSSIKKAKELEENENKNEESHTTRPRFRGTPPPVDPEILSYKKTPTNRPRSSGNAPLVNPLIFYQQNKNTFFPKEPQQGQSKEEIQEKSDNKTETPEI